MGEWSRPEYEASRISGVWRIRGGFQGNTRPSLNKEKTANTRFRCMIKRKKRSSVIHDVLMPRSLPERSCDLIKLFGKRMSKEKRKC
jgi:hypothetical protein